MKLREYLDKFGILIGTFSKKSGVHAPTIHRIIQGEDMMLSTAAKLVKASNGFVTYDDLLRKKRAPRKKPA